MCTCARPYGRVGRCGFGETGVTNGIRANPSGYAYRLVCKHRAHGACGLEMGHTAWHMGRHWTYGRALRGKVPGHLLGLVCGHMHARVGLRAHGMVYGSALDR
jgi:hypothetical protein